MLGVDAAPVRAQVPAAPRRKLKEESQEIEVVKLRIAGDVLLDAPIYEEKYGGRGNWLAVISLDPLAPGGLDRKFLDRGKGACLYVVEELRLFDALEFSADIKKPYTTSRKQHVRWFGVVIAKTDGYILVERHKKAADAVLRGKQARTSPVDRIRALTEQRDVLVSEAALIEAEIQELRRVMNNVLPLVPGGEDEVRRDVEVEESPEREGHLHAGEADVEQHVAAVDPSNVPVARDHDITDPEAVLGAGSGSKRD